MCIVYCFKGKLHPICIKLCIVRNPVIFLNGRASFHNFPLNGMNPYLPITISALNESKLRFFKGRFILPDPDETRPFVPNVVSETTLHTSFPFFSETTLHTSVQFVSETTLHTSVQFVSETSVQFQRCYGCYAIHPLEGSDSRVLNFRHQQSQTWHL